MLVELPPLAVHELETFHARESFEAAGMSAGGHKMTTEEENELRQQLAALREEHGDLDVAISALTGSASADTIPLQRLKKKKLALKDRISAIEDRLLPDIIA